MLPPLLAWGLLARGLGLVYAIAFSSIAVQVIGLAGRHGLSPFHPTLRSIRRDFPGALAWRYFPSFFLITGASDTALLGVPLLGAAAGLAAALGSCSHLALAYCWLALRSLDLPVGLLFPWDSLLFEFGALALLLPAIPSLLSSGTTLALDAPPHPWLAHALRWLLARVLLGFGKKKFVGTSLAHTCYIKNFLVAQPIPSPAGWLACRAPLLPFQLSLLAMFAVECVAPFLLLPAGTLRALAAASIGALMLGIQLTGNFGHFNVVTTVLCVGSLDVSSSVFDPLPPRCAAELATRVALGVHAAASLLFVLFDSWCATSWAYWPQPNLAQRAAVRALLAGCRFLADQRLLHAYGVFPPASNPPVRMAPVVEGSADGATWRRYAWRYIPSSAGSAPRFVAPHHPRLDHSVFYANFGTEPNNFLATINSPRPYAFARESLFHRIAKALLGGASPAARRLFRRDPFPLPGSPPKYVRVRLVALEPVGVVHAARTGEFWHERTIDVHLPAVALGVDGELAVLSGCSGGSGGGASPGARRARRSRSPARAPAAREAAAASPRAAREPLLFHVDLLPVWRERCPQLRALLAASLNGGAGARARDLALLSLTHPAGAAARAATGAAEEVHAPAAAEIFWRRFVPRVRDELKMSAWQPEAGGGLPARAAAIRSEFSAAEIRAFERIVGGLTLRMLVTLERLHVARELPLLGGTAPSYFHLALLAHALILRGPDAAGSALDPPPGPSPPLAASVGPSELTERGFGLYGALWTDMLVYHARKHRVAHEMMLKYTGGAVGAERFGHPCILPGFLLLLPTLAHALGGHVRGEQSFPQWVPPPPLGDWRPLPAEVHAVETADRRRGDKKRR